MIDAALYYANRGWYVFPCQPGLKIPYSGTRGVSEATTEEAMLKAKREQEQNKPVEVKTT